MKDARLYINNQEIEFSTAPDVLFTFQEDDLTNPTIVKNSYTKTVTIPGTPNNNSIFDGIWNVERIQGDDNFNVTKRVPFSLYVNGDIYQTGYAKLDKISRNNNKIEYSITLYGGLGQFLYNLSIDWNSGDKKTLADMDYFKSSESEEAYDLGFTINKDTVASAWTQINSNDKWGVVNFAPTYLGYPDKISCDKVLINFSGNSMTSAVTDGSTAFTPSGGFALGTSPQKLTSEEVRDYRSYIQTPVMRVHSIIDAICRKENNAGRYDEGYEVVLDNEFFNTANPYYWDAWVTLPTITNLEFSSEGGGGTTTAYTANPVSSEWDIFGNCLYTFELSETITGGNISVKATIDLGVTGTTTSDVLYFYYTHRYGRGQKVYKRNAYGLQLYASNSVTSSENVLAGSNVKWLSGEQRYTYADAVASGQFTPKWNTNVVENHTGYFTRVSGSTFHYTGTSGNLLELRCDLPIGTRYFKLFMKRCNSSNDSERNMLFTSTLANTGEKISVTPLPFNSKTIELSSIDSGESISNKYISKEMLLSTSYSPADWLLSYCKKFGLYIKKDVIDDKIYILTRNNYYKRDNIIDIEKDIDLSKTFDINPVYCQNGYLSLTDEGVESKSESDYTQKTGKIYGQKIVNTGYEFNADTKELNNGIFKNAVQAKDVSQYYYKPNASGLYPYVYNGFKYNLYENGDYSGSTKEYNQPSADIAQTFEAFDENFPNYDLISKPMFSDTDGKSLDTENVLLFFNGYENVSQYNWMLTDDIAYMYKLNNNPTWLLTLVEEDMTGNKIAKKITNFPRFSRWLEGNRWMIYSFDYGSPRLLYVPEMTNNDEGNVYWNYYKKYYEDLYDVDTKVVDCNTLGKFNEESLRYVYWFRNRYWRLNKITDYNPTSYNTTKTQFISLNDINSLTNEVTSRDLWLEVELDKYYLPQSGGTIIGTVRTSDNGPWTIESISISPSGDTAYTVTIDPMGGGADGNFTVTTNANNTLDDKIVTIVVTAGDIGKSVSFTQSGIDVSKEYFTLEVVSGTSLNIWLENTSVYGTDSGEPVKIYQNYDKVSSPKVYYKKSGDIWRYLTFETWNDGAHSDYITGLTPGMKVQFRSEGALFTGDTSMDYRYCFGFRFVFSGDSKVIAYGNAMSLIYGSDFEGKETFKSKFYGLDELLSQSVIDDAHLIDAKHLHLPATATSISCYYSMFKGCTELKRAPSSIKAKVLGRTSCIEMFQDCWSLTEAPEFNTGLTAYEACCTNMFRNCYSLKNAPSTINVSSYDIQEPDLRDVSEWGYFGVMFDGCSGLTSTPTLPSNNLGYKCYFGMFYDCTSLRNAPELPALNLADCCYAAMFDGCTSLRTPPELPATTLAKYCYENMFEDCSNLARTPELPAMVMAEGCYAAMFRRCSRLSNVKRIHATTMADSCFCSMFDGCTYLSTAPELPATTLAPNCYERMFFGCDRLSYIKCLAVTEHLTGETLNWVSGVSESGLFVKNPDAVWSRGVSGIPVGWSVSDSSPSELIISGLTWVTNIPASGGAATKNNCSYSVILIDTLGNETDVTNEATITGSTLIPSSTTQSVHTAGTLTLTADYLYLTATARTNVYQDAYVPPVVTAISINNLTWVNDIPASGGTASSANCTFNVIGVYSDASTGDVTTQTTVSGSVSVEESIIESRHQVGTLVLTADCGGATTTASTEVYQSAYIPPVTGLSLDNLTWVNDVPASGGTATSANCTFNVVAYYSNGTTGNVTTQSSISGSVSVEESMIESRHQVGTLVLTAEYSGITASASTDVYQSAYIPFITGITLENLTCAVDLTWKGGTATSANCTFNVVGYYSNSTTGDVTTSSVVTGSLVVPSSSADTRHSAGTLTLTATYDSFSATNSTTVYQDAKPSYNNYLTFDILSGGSIVWITTNSDSARTIQYSTDYGLTWESITSTTAGTQINVNTGDSVMFKGDNSVYGNAASSFNIFSATSGTRFNAKGNIMSLIDSVNFSGLTSVSSGCFSGLFSGCTALVNAEDLYLPATTLAQQCYAFMFSDCVNLITAPELHALSLAIGCYADMFYNCYSLTTAPVLSAQTLVTGCYTEMFYGCYALNYIKCLATNRDGYRPTENWVSGVQTQSGTFVKDSTMTWSTGTSGIPSGWTVVDA